MTKRDHSRLLAITMDQTYINPNLRSFYSPNSTEKEDFYENQFYNLSVSLLFIMPQDQFVVSFHHGDHVHHDDHLLAAGGDGTSDVNWTSINRCLNTATQLASDFHHLLERYEKEVIKDGDYINFHLKTEHILSVRDEIPRVGSKEEISQSLMSIYGGVWEAKAFLIYVKESNAADQSGRFNNDYAGLARLLSNLVMSLQCSPYAIGLTPEEVDTHCAAVTDCDYGSRDYKVLNDIHGRMEQYARALEEIVALRHT